MKLQQILITLLWLMALGLGVGPIAAVVSFDVDIPLDVILPLNFIGWLSTCLLFVSRSRLNQAVDQTTDALSLNPVDGELEAKIVHFLNETSRYHRAAFRFRADDTVTGDELSVNLKRIVEMAYDELSAKSAELSLFDEQSGLWSQAMLVGEPMSLESQSFLNEINNSQDSPADEEKNKSVLTKPVAFAGTMFGALRVELPEGVEATETDQRVLHLLATQGALLLVDARFTEELLRMRRTGDESVRAKTGFLANLSHEIRGPLGIILNAAELAIDGLCGPLTEQQAETLRMIKDAGDHLLDLVNDVLDYAKVEAGKVSAKPVEIPVRQLLDDLVTVVRSQAIEKGHDLILDEVEEDLGVVCDKRHARQILINFLTNAIKYTQSGGTIRVGAERLAAHRVRIYVSDTGVGIPEKERDKVFGAFERIDHSYSSTQMGTGLGMSLTKKLAEVNDGAVDFKSEEGRGSVFWVNLYGVTMDIGEATQDEADESKLVPQGQGEHILLVEHDQETIDILERYLVHQGFVVVQARTGSDVIKCLRDETIDLAVVENDLPDSSGEEMVSIIRSSPKGSAVPIILLSSKAFVFDIERFLKLGVDRCLSKPVSLIELAKTSRRLIDESRMLDSPEPEPQGPQQLV